MRELSKTYTYPAIDRLMWAFVAAGAGIVLLLLGLGLPAFVPQQSRSTARWLEVLTGSATGQPTFNIPLTQVIFVILGIFALINAVLIYRIGSASVIIDDEVIIYQRGDKTVRVPWTKVIGVNKRLTACAKAGVCELVTIVTKIDSHVITFNSKITGYDEIMKAIQTHTKVKF
jgi:hypothetical protein